MKHYLLFFLVACNLFGVLHNGGNRENGPSLEYCPNQTTGRTDLGETIVVCKGLFPTRPFIRLPKPDEKLQDGNQILHVGASVPPYNAMAGGYLILTDRNGKRFVIVDSTGKTAPFSKRGTTPDCFHAPSYRYLYTLYEVKGKVGGEVDLPGLGKVSTIKIESKDCSPEVMVDGVTADNALLGTWEGTVSERLLQPTGIGPMQKNFDENKRVPIQIKFTDSTLLPLPMSDWKGRGRLSDERLMNLKGAVTNLKDDVKGANGKMIPALSSLGERNPFKGANDGTVNLYRQPDMHGLGFDAHWVLEYPFGVANITKNGMSESLDYFAPSSLILTDDKVLSDEQKEVQIYPHIPYRNNGHRVDIHWVSLQK